MMNLAGHQETEPHCTDPASLAEDAQFEAGWNFAASLDSVTRHQKYRDWHRHMTINPFSRGFAAMTTGTHEGARPW